MEPLDMAPVDKAERLFELALARPPPERGAFLDAACVGEPELRRELAALLPHAEAEPDFLAIPAVQLAMPHLARFFGHGAGEGVGLPDNLGGYRIVCRLGYGAMGVIYEARRQAPPFLARRGRPERSVALKLPHPGPPTPALKLRFAAEARLLARLRHPGIVRLFEAGVEGVNGPGRMDCRVPFLVIELVRGQRLDRYVSGARLSLDDRLRLFAKICDAVDHAHRRGVIHRDLKPANIVVENGGQPKILDFGIARAVGADGETRPPIAAKGQVLGTLAYMSPEQLGDRHNRGDVRSDVWALGVILYQLLADQLPYEVSHLSVAEVAGLIDKTRAAPLDSLDCSCHGGL